MAPLGLVNGNSRNFPHCLKGQKHLMCGSQATKYRRVKNSCSVCSTKTTISLKEFVFLSQEFLLGENKLYKSLMLNKAAMIWSNVVKTVILWNITTIQNNYFLFWNTLKCNFFLWWRSWIFSSYYSGLQCHMILRNHSATFFILKLFVTNVLLSLLIN